MRKIIRLPGERYGRLSLIKQVSSGKHPAWLCSCDCGTKKVVIFESLKSGKTKSCGCFNLESIIARNTTHGCAPSSGVMREYRIWGAIKTRCYNKNIRSFADYGARGITVCKRWRSSFALFLKDMGRAPEGYSIERRNNNGPYSPRNCYWADNITQANNRRGNRRLVFNGKDQTVSQWAREIGMADGTLTMRLNLGWSIEDALTKPIRRW